MPSHISVLRNFSEIDVLLNSSNTLVARYLIYLAMAATAVRLMQRSDRVSENEDEVESQGRAGDDHRKFLLS